MPPYAMFPNYYSMTDRSVWVGIRTSGDEVCFPFFPSRGSQHVWTALGLMSGSDRVLLTDGYAAYEKYAKKLEITHAQWWVHCRRTFFEALQADPEAVEAALKQIAALYKIEDQIREQSLSGERERQHRLTHSKPQVEAFFAWIDRPDSPRRGRGHGNS